MKKGIKEDRNSIQLSYENYLFTVVGGINRSGQVDRIRLKFLQIPRKLEDVEIFYVSIFNGNLFPWK